MGTVAEGNLRADYGSNARIKQTLRSSLEPVLVLRQVLVSGPITALAAADARLQSFGGALQALAVDASRVRKDLMGP